METIIIGMLFLLLVVAVLYIQEQDKEIEEEKLRSKMYREKLSEANSFRAQLSRKLGPIVQIHEGLGIPYREVVRLVKQSVDEGKVDPRLSDIVPNTLAKHPKPQSPVAKESDRP